MSNLDRVIKSICLDREKLDALDVLCMSYRGRETYNQLANRFGLATKNGVNYEAWPEWEELMSAVDYRDTELLPDWMPRPTRDTNRLMRQMVTDIKGAIAKDQVALEGAHE